MAEDKESYFAPWDTWMVVSGDCPECGDDLAGNGKIKDCVGCKWWGLDDDRYA